MKEKLRKFEGEKFEEKNSERKFFMKKTFVGQNSILRNFWGSKFPSRGNFEGQSFHQAEIFRVKVSIQKKFFTL